MLPSLNVKITADPSAAKTGFKEIERSVDALDRATLEYQTRLTKLEASMKAGLITEKAMAKAANDAATAYKKAATSAASYAGATVEFSNATKVATRNMAQSSGHTANIVSQFNDIAVMMAAGQNPLMLAMQQGTQLTQIFTQMGGKPVTALKAVAGGLMSMINPMSLVTLGVIAGGAALTQWAVSAVSSKEETEALDEALAALGERATDTATKLGMLQAGIATAEEFLVIQQINALEAERLSLMERAEAQSGRNRRATELQAQAIQQQIDGLQDVLDAARENERALADAEAQQRRIAQAYQTYANSRVQSERDHVASLSEAYGLYADTRVEANQLAYEIGIAQANALALAGVDITSGVSAAAQAAANLAANLGIALGAAINLQNLQSSKQYSGRGGDPRKMGDDYMSELGYTSVSDLITQMTPKTARGGGGRGGTSAAEKRQEQLARELETLQEALATEQETINEAYQTQMTTLEDALAAKLLTQQEYDELSLRSKQEFNEAWAQLEREQQNATLDAWGGMFGDLSSLMSSENKKLFNIGKAAAIAEATVNGYKAAVSAWDKGMAVGGPAVAAAFTAASLAKTGAMIGNIASTNIGGGGGGSSSGGSSAAATATTAESSQGPLQVGWNAMNPNELITVGMAQRMFEMISDEAGDRGFTIMRTA